MLNDDELQSIIARVRGRVAAADAQGSDGKLLRAADELHTEQTLTSQTWDVLAAHYDPAQIIELLFTVGQYTTLSRVTNALKISLEPHLEGLPSRAEP